MRQIFGTANIADLPAAVVSLKVLETPPGTYVLNSSSLHQLWYNYRQGVTIVRKCSSMSYSISCEWCSKYFVAPFPAQLWFNYRGVTTYPPITVHCECVLNILFTPSHPSPLIWQEVTI